MEVPGPEADWELAKVWVNRDQADVDAALDVLLEALGIGREALTYYLDPETGTFVDLRAGAGG